MEKVKELCVEDLFAPEEKVCASSCRTDLQRVDAREDRLRKEGRVKYGKNGEDLGWLVRESSNFSLLFERNSAGSPPLKERGMQ